MKANTRIGISTLRDRKKITATLLEGKIHSSPGDFSLQAFKAIPAAEKSSRSERFFSSIRVTFISLRSLPLLFLCSSFELITDYRFANEQHPRHIRSEYRNVGNANFRTESVKPSHLHYSDAFAYLYYSHSITPDNSLSWKVGYSYLGVSWEKNPRFRGTNYNFANASVGWVSTSLEHWRWILAGGVTVDANSCNFGQTGVYQGLLWGRYSIRPQIGLHIGALGYAGVKNGYLLPILGADYSPTKHWQINAIFPINVMVEYKFNPHLSTYIEYSSFGRPYRFPVRAKIGIGQYENGIFEVYSNGVELDLDVHSTHTFSLAVGGGWNFGGWMLIKNSDNHHGRYYKFDSAPYAQARFTCTF